MKASYSSFLPVFLMLVVTGSAAAIHSSGIGTDTSASIQSVDSQSDGPPGKGDPSSRRVLDGFTFLGHYLSNPSENLELQFTVSFIGVPGLLGQISATTGVGRQVGTAANASHFSLGVGYIVPGDDVSLLFFANAGRRTATSATNGRNSSMVVFLSSYLRWDLLTEDYELLIGGRFYLLPQKTEYQSFTGTLSIGFGVVVL